MLKKVISENLGKVQGSGLFALVLSLGSFSSLVKSQKLIYPAEMQLYFLIFLTLLLSGCIALQFINSKNKKIFLSMDDGVAILFLFLLLVYSLAVHPLSLYAVFFQVTLWSYIVLRNCYHVILDYFDIFCISILASGLVQSVLGLLQLYDIAPTFGFFKLIGTFDNPGPFGIFVASVFVFSVGLANSATRSITRNLAFICCITCILVLPATNSRASWLGCIGGCTYFVMRYYSPFLQMSVCRAKIVKYISGAILMLLAISLWFYKIDSAMGRMLIWKVSLGMITDSPVIGTGIGTFKHMYPRYQAEYFSKLSSGQADDEAMRSDMIEYAFNDLIQLSAELGILGAVVFAAFVILIVLRPDGGDPRSISAKAAIICLVMCSLFSYPFQVGPIWWLFLSYAMIAHSSESKFLNRSFMLSSGFKVLLALFLLVTYCGVFLWVRNDFLAKKAWRVADSHFRAGNPRLAEQTYRGVVVAIPYDKEPLLFYGKSLMTNGKDWEAAKILEAAAKSLSDPVLYSNLGKVNSRLGNTRVAEHFYKEASWMIPNRMYPKYLLALLYLGTGEEARADSMARRIVSMPVKVRSSATDEMIGEMRALLQKKKIIKSLE